MIVPCVIALCLLQVVWTAPAEKRDYPATSYGLTSESNTLSEYREVYLAGYLEGYRAGYKSSYDEACNMMRSSGSYKKREVKDLVKKLLKELDTSDKDQKTEKRQMGMIGDYDTVFNTGFTNGQMNGQTQGQAQGSACPPPAPNSNPPMP